MAMDLEAGKIEVTLNRKHLSSFEDEKKGEPTYMYNISLELCDCYTWDSQEKKFKADTREENQVEFTTFDKPANCEFKDIVKDMATATDEEIEAAIKMHGG